MRELSKRLDTRTSEFSDYMEFFHRLRDHFDLGVYNLNYDAVARNAMPEACCGFDNHGNFDLSGVNLRREWGFVYHLHGSVHHCIANNISRPWIIWKEELGGAFTDTGITEVDMAQGFRPIPLTTLLAGGFKLDQLLAEPYQTFYSTLVRHVHEADAILIAGYGFGDLHVNRVLRNRFEGPDDDKPQVVILEKSCPKRPRTARLEINKFWSWELKHTLNTSFQKALRDAHHKIVVQSAILLKMRRSKRISIIEWVFGMVDFTKRFLLSIKSLIGFRSICNVVLN